ncbi:MAG TPA: hypothetical protein VII51_09450 [Gaiellaceae bacterium]
MRLRSTVVLVVMVVLVAAVGAWADRPHVAVEKPPRTVPATRPWRAVVEISRRGRRLDGFRPVLTITGEGAKESFGASEFAPGRYRVQVLFPYPGHYTYTVTVPNGIGSRGTIQVVAR